jgi:hypothetical protein
MRILGTFLFVAATSTMALCAPGHVLQNVTKIQVDPTVVEQPDNVKESAAANLARYDLRAAVKDAHIEEGQSPIRAHIVLDGFSTETTKQRLLGLGTGKNISTVDGRLVIQDSDGNELASVMIHVRGSAAFSPSDQDGGKSRQAASDLEERLLEEIEKLK